MSTKLTSKISSIFSRTELPTSPQLRPGTEVSEVLSATVAPSMHILAPSTGGLSHMNHLSVTFSSAMADRSRLDRAHAGGGDEVDADADERLCEPRLVAGL